MGYLFLVLNIILLAVAVIFSFNKKVNFFGKWKFIAIAVLLTVSLFTMLDILFTSFEIWMYHYFKMMGIKMSKIPLEMFLYYFFLSFGFLLVLEFVKTFFTKKLSVRWTKAISILLFFVFSILCIMSLGKLYTSLISLLLGVFIFQFLLFLPKWLPTFYITFLLCFIPFLLIELLRISSGMLMYNDIEKTGAELINIPIENFCYLFLFCMVNVFFYHLFMPRKLKRYAQHITENSHVKKNE